MVMFGKFDPFLNLYQKLSLNNTYYLIQLICKQHFFNRNLLN